MKINMSVQEFLAKCEVARLLSSLRGMPGIMEIAELKVAGKISSRQQHELAYELGKNTMAQALREVFPAMR